MRNVFNFFTDGTIPLSTRVSAVSHFFNTAKRMKQAQCYHSMNVNCHVCHSSPGSSCHLDESDEQQKEPYVLRNLKLMMFIPITVITILEMSQTSPHTL